ncbi:MAG: hypothetical protein KGH87_06660 [Thaumarchaeota archaeon]|nr:hypothetical protein [Nitrososphaerota archaeon]MDE1839584.1 hypothetical protein [Nitrososphaerota archaeon]
MSDTNKTDSDVKIKTHAIEDKTSLIQTEMPRPVYADSVKLAIDYDNLTATLLLFTKHIVPKFDKTFRFSNIQWELIGQVKVPLAEMYNISQYYISRVRESPAFKIISAEIKGPVNEEQTHESFLDFGPVSKV